MRAILAITLLIPVTAFSGCLVCEVSGGCWALTGVYAYVDLSPQPNANSVEQAFAAMGFKVDQRDPYIQASADESVVPEGELVSARLHGLIVAPTGVSPPPNSVRLCIHYGDWSHHNSRDDAIEDGREHREQVEAHAKNVTAEFAKRLALRPVSDLSWETHFHKQGAEREDAFSNQCF